MSRDERRERRRDKRAARRGAHDSPALDLVEGVVEVFASPGLWSVAGRVLTLPFRALGHLLDGLF